MPADTFSAGLGYLIMGTGNDNNTWGDNANSDVFQIFEDALVGMLTTSVTGGTTDLSASPPPAGPSAARYHTLKFNGALSSDQTLIVPNLVKRWQIWNNTSNSFDFFAKTTSGSTVFIPQGTITDVWCDGNNGLRRIGARTGEIFAHGATTAPAGALECDGTALTRSSGKGRELFNIISTTWGSGNGVTTFNIPDLTTAGRYLRPRIASVTSVGDLLAGGMASHTHTGSVSVTVSGGSVSGTTSGRSATHTHGFSGSVAGTTSDESNTHTHTQIAATFNGSYAGAAFNGPSGNGSQTGPNSTGHTHTFSASFSGTTGADSVDHTHTFSASLSGASGSGSFTTDANVGALSETRPISATVLMCIWL